MWCRWGASHLIRVHGSTIAEHKYLKVCHAAGTAQQANKTPKVCRTLWNQADALFDMLDKNGDGVLDRQEWIASVGKA